MLVNKVNLVMMIVLPKLVKYLIMIYLRIRTNPYFIRRYENLDNTFYIKNTKKIVNNIKKISVF